VGRELPPWSSHVLTVAVNRGRLTDTQTDDAYALFLADKGLSFKVRPRMHGSGLSSSH
jgi:hypothetical protein